MDNKKMGRFIAELRRSHQMTQKQLAEKLNVTDKAVSKWERGMSCPDISLLAPIASILGVTTGELLNGEKGDADGTDVEIAIDHALQYADASIKIRQSSLHHMVAASYSVLLLLGVLTCGICDLALSGAFTWSLIPISAIAYVWLSFIPVIWLGKRGAVFSLIVISALTLPYLNVLDSLIAAPSIMPIGARMFGILIVYLWVLFALFKLLKNRRLVAAAIALFLAIPAYLTANSMLAVLIPGETLLDVWDALNFSIFIVAGIVLLGIDMRMRKIQKKEQ